MLSLQLSSIALIIDYKLRRFETSYKRTSSIIITLKYRFLKEKDNVISVFDFLNKVDISLISHFFVIIRLNLVCLNRNIYFYINVFFYVHIFFSLSNLIRILLINVSILQLLL